MGVGDELVPSGKKSRVPLKPAPQTTVGGIPERSSHGGQSKFSSGKRRTSSSPVLMREDPPSIKSSSLGGWGSETTDPAAAVISATLAGYAVVINYMQRQSGLFSRSPRSNCSVWMLPGFEIVTCT